ncbi:MAG: hypothetical protein ABIH50_06250 [bacterium]
MEQLLSPLIALWPVKIKLILALIIPFIGFLLAKAVWWITTTLLKALRLDLGAKKIGLASFLEKGEIKRSTIDLIGDLAYWTTIFISMLTVAKVLGVPTRELMFVFFGFIRTVFVVALVLGTGLFLAALLSSIIKAMAINFGLDGAKTFSRLIYYIVIVFAFLLALAQLGIKTDLIVAKLDVIIGALGLAAAIAFGLGCKDMAADFLHNLFKGK